MKNLDAALAHRDDTTAVSNVDCLYIRREDLQRVYNGCDLGDAVKVAVYQYPHVSQRPDMILFKANDTTATGPEFPEADFAAWIRYQTTGDVEPFQRVIGKWAWAKRGEVESQKRKFNEGSRERSFKRLMQSRSRYQMLEAKLREANAEIERLKGGGHCRAIVDGPVLKNVWSTDFKELNETQLAVIEHLTDKANLASIASQPKDET